MGQEEIEQLLDRLGEGTEKAHDAIERAKAPRWKTMPTHLLRRYRQAKKWQERVTDVFLALPYARTDPDALVLGIEALGDKSKVVRYRACMLLAYSLSRTAIPQLKARLQSEDDRMTIADLKAAIDAIEHNNHHYFVDREHSNQMFWNVKDFQSLR